MAKEEITVELKSVVGPGMPKALVRILNHPQPTLTIVKNTILELAGCLNMVVRRKATGYLHEETLSIGGIRVSLK